MKKLLATLTICLVMASTVRAQVFIMESDDENPRGGVESQWGYIPDQWETSDQANAFAPIGEGAFVLMSLAGAYLMKKKTKKNE